jgi:DNA-binding transcriptional LysR family regulator
MLEEVTLAAPAYVHRFGMPAHPEKLDGHRMIGFRSSATGGLLPLEFQIDGAVREITLPATITVNAAESYFAAAKLGLGLIQVPRYHTDEAIRSGQLLHVLPDYPPTRTPVSMLYPRSRQLSPRVRVFIDWLVKIFAGQNSTGTEAG